MQQKIGLSEIKKAVLTSEPITYTTFTLHHEEEQYLEDLLGAFLQEVGQGNLKDAVGYCMKELAVNAKKANTKRIYFLSKGLDITKKDEYEKGMKTFKQETLDNMSVYLKEMEKSGLYVKVTFFVKGNKFTLTICNNVEISKNELMRVYDRIARARAFETMEDAFAAVLDDSEGAGLGIVIIMQLLRKIGLDESVFDIDAKGGETVATITIPFSEVHMDNIRQLSVRIVQEIDGLPQFSDSILALQKLINTKDAEIPEIAHQISTDPALTGELLKVVNSAQFLLPKRVDNILEAVKLIGLRGINNLIFSYETQKILGTKDKRIWDHSYRTAYYAYMLGKSMKKKKSLDDMYVGGILHDMGKIVFSKVHPSLLEKIDVFCRERDLNRNFFEDLSAGLNHAEIGALLAEKWNFPEALIEAIKFHHDPKGCRDEFRDVVYTVYLANTLCSDLFDIRSLALLEKDVLDRFEIKTAQELAALQTKLKTAFMHEHAEQA